MGRGIEKVLVTGGAGFIGSHTADLLVERGEWNQVPLEVGGLPRCSIRENPRWFAPSGVRSERGRDILASLEIKGLVRGQSSAKSERVLFLETCI
jgi:hypothetical protein